MLPVHLPAHVRMCGANDVKEEHPVDWNAYEYHATSGSWIAKDFRHGSGFEHGPQCIIDPDAVVGDDVRLGHRVHVASARACSTTSRSPTTA